MTKQEILDFVNKVNYAYTYGCQNFIHELSNKIDRYVAERIQEELDKKQPKPELRSFVFNVDCAAIQGEAMETVAIRTIQELYLLAIKHGGTGGQHWNDKEIPDIVVQFTDEEGKTDQWLTIYDDYLE